MKCTYDECPNEAEWLLPQWKPDGFGGHEVTFRPVCDVDKSGWWDPNDPDKIDLAFPIRRPLNEAARAAKMPKLDSLTPEQWSAYKTQALRLVDEALVFINRDEIACALKSLGRAVQCLEVIENNYDDGSPIPKGNQK